MLQNELTDSHCPLAETLALYSQALLPDEQHKAIVQHIARCLRCSGWLDWYRLQRAAVSSPLDRGSDRLADLAKSLFARSLYRYKPVFLQSHTIFDSCYAVSGTRNLSTSESRRMLFTTDGAEIDIEITRSKNGVNLRGQVYAGSGSLHVGVYRDGHLEQSCYTNSLDEFSFQNLGCADTLQIGLEHGIAILELPRNIFNS